MRVYLNKYLFKILKDLSGISNSKPSTTGLGSCAKGAKSFLFLPVLILPYHGRCNTLPNTRGYSTLELSAPRCARDSAVICIEAVNKKNDTVWFPNKIINIYNNFLFQGKKRETVFQRMFLKIILKTKRIRWISVEGSWKLIGK